MYVCWCEIKGRSRKYRDVEKRQKKMYKKIN